MTEQKKHLSYTFYRISIALAVFIAFFLQTFLLVDGTNIFMSHFTQWNAREVSLPITIGGYIAIVTTFLIGSWLIRHKGRGMMLALILVSGIATVMLAFCESSYPLYFAAIIIINITLGALLVLMTAIITNWFNSTRGRMLGLVHRCLRSCDSAASDGRCCIPVHLSGNGYRYCGLWRTFIPAGSLSS